MNAPHETPATDLPPVLPPPGAMPGHRCARVWLVAAWWAWSTAGAQTPDERALLGEVPSVFAGSKYDQPLSEAPADVSIVTRAAIQRYGWLTLADPAGPEHRQDRIPSSGRQVLLKLEYAFR